MLINTEGSFNVAVGHDTLAANVIGEGNTCVGYKSLLVNEASFITAVGFLALTANTIGISNVAVGANALTASIDGNANTAVGADALAANTGPGDNIAIGFGAGAAGVLGTANIIIGNGAADLIEGSDNIIIGHGAFAASFSPTAIANIAIGTGALAINDGLINVAIGNEALSLNPIAINTIAIGTGAGIDDTLGADNIWIGSPGFDTFTTIGIGTPLLHNIACFPETCFTTFAPLAVGLLLGSPTAGYAQFGIFPPPPSAKRFKHDIEDMGINSEFIYKLRPVTFKYNDDLTFVSKDKINNRQYGLIAEEVGEVMPNLVLSDPLGSGEIFSVDYDALAPMLLNEVQKINKKVTELQEKDLTIADLRENNKKMKKIINNLMARIQKLEAHIPSIHF